MICSRCNKKIEDIVIRIEQKIDLYKITDQGLYSPFGNISEPTYEYLCPECFEKYVECMNQLNEDFNGKYLVDMVEIVDDVQYGEE